MRYIFFFCLTLPLFALGRRSGDPSAPGPLPGPDSGSLPLSVPGPSGAPVYGGDWIELEGRVRLLGSEPFPQMALTDETGQDWYLDGPTRRVLGAREHRMVRIRGKVELQELVLANGRSLGIRRSLSEIKLLE